MQNDITPTARSVGYANFGSGITTRSIFEDQTEIGWTNFLCGRWGVKWKEAQKRHYLRMNKRKSAHLWVIAILKKLLLLRWDLWQFHNAALHSPTGATAITSHRSLNYKIDKNEIRRGRGCIDCSNYCVFSPPYTLTKLQSSSIHEKELWLYEVSLACKGYVEPDDTVTRQAISQRNQIHSFLITDGLFIQILPRKRPVATQNNRITDEEQNAAAVLFFGPPAKRARVTPPVATTDNLPQQTLFTAR